VITEVTAAAARKFDVVDAASPPCASTASRNVVN
jgi:hypothetical protein